MRCWSVYIVTVTAEDEPDPQVVSYQEVDRSDNNSEPYPILVNCWVGPGPIGPPGPGKLIPVVPNNKSDNDDRNQYQDPPSLPPDTGGYVERTLDLDCYWLDDDGCYTDAAGTIPCDSPAGGGNGDGYTSAEESHNDFGLTSLTNDATGKTGYDAIDADHDCLLDQGITGTAATVSQPGQPVDLPNSPSDLITKCTAADGWVDYSGAPTQAAAVNTKAADRDCGGLSDGVEVFFGSNPVLADSDNDGANDYVEMADFTNPNDPDTDGDGYLDRPVNRFINDGSNGVPSDYSMDNCPAVYNPDQLNTDGKSRDNGPKVPGTVASNPNQDKTGDACDLDSDNDGLPDVAEAIAGTNRLNPDTDGDRIVDGAETYLGSNPNDPASKPAGSAWTLHMTKFFRACRWSLPPLGEYGGLWDAKYSTNPDRSELDPDGDGINCMTADGTAPLDPDNDNGTGTLAAAPLELSDVTEIQGYFTNPANKDTDGDGCEDWIEVMDINGDRKVTVGDQTALAKRAAGLSGYEPDVVSDAIYDVNKDGKITVGDQTLMAKNTCALKPSGVGCPQCPAEK